MNENAVGSGVQRSAPHNNFFMAGSSQPGLHDALSWLNGGSEGYINGFALQSLSVHVLGASSVSLTALLCLTFSSLEPQHVARFWAGDPVPAGQVQGRDLEPQRCEDYQFDDLAEERPDLVFSAPNAHGRTQIKYAAENISWFEAARKISHQVLLQTRIFFFRVLQNYLWRLRQSA